MPHAETVVQLKRRVRNAATELFEWCKCECRITDDGTLVVETVDDDETGELKGEAAASESTRVVVDLAWQLHALEQKRKCKTRCELQYVVPGTRAVAREELMAPSPRYCQEWIELVRDAEKSARRRESIRQGTATATAVAAMNSTLAASSSAASSCGSNAPKPQSDSTSKPTAIAAPFDASVSSISASSAVSSGGLVVDTMRSTRKDPPPRRRSHQRQLPRGTVLLSQRNQYDDSGDEEEGDDHDDLPSPKGVRPTVPLPRASLSQRGGSRRSMLPQDSQLTAETTFDVDESVDHAQPQRSGQRYHDEQDDYGGDEVFDDDDEDEGDEEEIYAPFDRRPHVSTRTARALRGSVSSTTTGIPRHKKASVLSPSSLSSSHVTTIPPRCLVSPPASTSLSSTFSATSGSRRPSSATLLPTTRRSHVALASCSRRRSPPLVRSTGATSAAAVAASIQRLRRREGRRSMRMDVDGDDEDSVAALNGHGDTREELDILLRVETALRQLERENALAKEREAALAHQVSSLQDALRVRSAEKKHLEAHVQQLTRDKDEWKQAAHRAERALAQLQDELAIAQEETQLQHSERHRLKHQNKELLSQVHRLDSIVYGRF